MTETGQQRAVTAAFPPPPPFWKYFSSTNLEKLEELKREESSKNNKENSKTWFPADLRSLQLPPELRYLVPPEPPQSGHYNLFGEAQSVCGINYGLDCYCNAHVANRCNLFPIYRSRPTFPLLQNKGSNNSILPRQRLMKVAPHPSTTHTTC